MHGSVLNFCHLDFGFVSDLDIRISDLKEFVVVIFLLLTSVFCFLILGILGNLVHFRHLLLLTPVTNMSLFQERPLGLIVLPSWTGSPFNEIRFNLLHNPGGSPFILRRYINKREPLSVDTDLIQ